MWPASRSQCPCITHIYAPSTSQYSCCLLPRSVSTPPSYENCMSVPSRHHPNQSNLLDLCLVSIQVLSHLKTGSKILVSPSSRWHLNSIQIVITISQLHSDPFSNPYRSQDVHLKPIHVLPHLHPGLMFIVSPPSMSFTSIQYNIFISHPQPGPNFCNSPPSSPPFT